MARECMHLPREAREVLSAQRHVVEFVAVGLEDAVPRTKARDDDVMAALQHLCYRVHPDQRVRRRVRSDARYAHRRATTMYWNAIRSGKSHGATVLRATRVARAPIRPISDWSSIKR